MVTASIINGQICPVIFSNPFIWSIWPEIISISNIPTYDKGPDDTYTLYWLYLISLCYGAGKAIIVKTTGLYGVNTVHRTLYTSQCPEQESSIDCLSLPPSPEDNSACSPCRPAVTSSQSLTNCIPGTPALNLVQFYWGSGKYLEHQRACPAGNYDVRSVEITRKI